MPYQDDETRLLKDRESHNKRTAKYKAEGKCVCCGKVKDREDRQVCSSCIKKRTVDIQKTRDVCRALGICPICFKEKLIGSEKSCPECRAKNANYKAKIRVEHKEEYYAYQSKWRKETYRKRKEQGICTKCGKRKAIPDRTMCGICNAKNNERRMAGKIIRSERNSYGLCYICGKPLDRKGRQCEACASNSRESLVKANAALGGWNNDFLFGGN